MLLSIYIPTYNRSVILRRQLSCLVAYLSAESELISKVELVVSDNASSDETREFIQEFISYNHNVSVRSHTNARNIGPSANFLQATDLCSGEYIWLLGDDDIVLLHNLKQLVAILEDNNFEAVFLGENEGTNDSKEKFTIVDRSMLFQEFPITSLGHISRIILKRRVFADARVEIEKSPSYFAWIMAMSFATLPDASKIATTNFPMLFPTKDGGMAIWRFKTSLARLVEFFHYCKISQSSNDEMPRIIAINFDRPTILKNYIKASLFFPNETEAFQSIEPLLAEFGLSRSFVVFLSRILRWKYMSFMRSCIIQLVR